jgi:glutathione synthase
MSIKLGVVMDDIALINYKKDSTLAMLWEAEKRGWEIFYFTQNDLFLKAGGAYGTGHKLSVYKDEKKWFALGAQNTHALGDLDVILMRVDPPFNTEYIYTTYILEQAEMDGAFVLNKPQALRDANEKIAATWFPTCCPPTIVARNMNLLRDFYHEHKSIVCKPLDSMGGSSVFHLKENDANANVVFEVLSERGSFYMMAQKFIPEITAGDKRILMINGEPVEMGLARIPGTGQWRGNLAAGARGVVTPLTENDLRICREVGPVLRKKGLYFAGIDVIGDYLTEVNVTSPTCIREIDEQGKLNVSAQLFDCIQDYIGVTV